MLNYIFHRGPDGQVPLVIAHGLFGSGRNWGVIAKRLSDARPVVAVDMRNHGESFHDPDHSYPALAEDLARVIEAFGGVADILGHSMGGKAAMVLALARPELIRRLVVADIAPVAYGHSQMPVLEAMRAVDLSRVGRRADADAQLAAGIADPALRAFLLQSLAVEAGAAHWRLNLGALARQMELIMGFPETGGPSDLPAVFLRGGASDYLAGPHEARARELFPAASVETLPGLGHWLHAEDPRGVEAAMRAVLPG